MKDALYTELLTLFTSHDQIIAELDKAKLKHDKQAKLSAEVDAMIASNLLTIKSHPPAPPIIPFEVGQKVRITMGCHPPNKEAFIGAVHLDQRHPIYYLTGMEMWRFHYELERQ